MNNDIEKLPKIDLSHDWYKENNIDKRSYLEGFKEGYKFCLQDMKELIEKNINEL